MSSLYLNGRFLPLDQGFVSVEDRGFQFGDGVYEVIRVYNGKPFRLSRHLARLEQSVRGIEIRMPEPAEKMAEVCRALVGELREAQIYLQVTRGTAPRVHAFPKECPPTFVAYSREIKPPPPERTFKLKSLPDDRWGRCHLKTICLLANILGKQHAVEAGCDEGLFVRDDGTVTEGTSSNAFFVRAGTLFTHPATNRILNGVTREVILELARERKIPVREEALSFAEAASADEAFITGTLSEITPAVSIDGRPVGSGATGPVTRTMRDAYRELTRRETS